ncbi:MAG TPA: tripartite tricarboxylate transporter permease [Candidatus Binatia bacterium]|jgi:TctA family transporter|nr:tripartite tricarboxylate transporter permease [Candidatus Binatia bacterium]
MLEYLQAFNQGLVNILPFTAQGTETFLYMMLGMAIGFAVGILPGLGGATTLALMLPFIYNMDPTTAFAFLLGSNAVTATTGDITSVLFGVPGEGITAATIVDGHPMAKNGQAGRALGAALMSSLVGAVFGAFILALAIPIVSPLVLSIGSAEFFMLALLGITFVASLSGENVPKGLVAGGLGLVLAMVGLDPIESIPRFTLEGALGEDNALFLWDGVSLISVTIGLFAIPEIIDLAVKGSSIAGRDQPTKLGGVLEGVKDTFRHWNLVLRCSGIGAYIGLIPGMGGGPAQWLAYAHAVQSSPNKERFGKGAVEGVLGPGAANNSKEGGSLIPTLAFGVPGSVSMAILLGAFIIQGIVPGPDLLNPAKHLTLTFSMVWIIVVTNIITVAICFLFLNQLAKITFVKGTYLIPFLLLLVYLGGFATKNSFGDILLVLIFGAFGWLMVKFDWQRPPLLLGLVLGGIAENNLFIASQIYGYSWLAHPGVVVIGLIIIAGLLYPYLHARLKALRESPNDSNRDKISASFKTKPIPLAPRYARSLFALFIMGIFGYVVYQAQFGFGAFEPRAALFPWVIGVPSLVLAYYVFMRECLQSTRKIKVEEALYSEPEVHPIIARKRTISIASWIIGFFIAIWLLGFTAASAVATFLYLKFGAREKWPITLGLTLASWLFFYGFFDYGLQIPFPDGTLFDWVNVDIPAVRNIFLAGG